MSWDVGCWGACDSNEADDGSVAWRIRHVETGRLFPVQFGRSADACRAAELANELMPLDGITDIEEARRMSVERYGAGGFRKLLIENSCAW